MDDADASARTTRPDPVRRGAGPGRAAEQRLRARQRGAGAVSDGIEDMSACPMGCADVGDVSHAP